MSIRLLLDGHNFSRASASIAEFRTKHGGTVPAVSFDTAKTVLMPASIYEQGVEEDYLALNGMGCSAEETAVVSEIWDGIIAVIGISKEVRDLVVREFGDGVRTTSPLLEIAAGRKRDVNIRLTDKNVYLAVWEKGLRMAEVLPDNSVDSLLYYMQVVGRRFKLRRFDINVGGEHAGVAANSLRQYFGRVKISAL